MGAMLRPNRTAFCFACWRVMVTLRRRFKRDEIAAFKGYLL